MNDFEKRKKLAQANLSRMFLYYNDFITEKQNESIREKINIFKECNDVHISTEQLNSVDYVYNDNPIEDFEYIIVSHEASHDWGNCYNFMEIHGYAVGKVYTMKEEVGVAYIEGLHVTESERNKKYGTDMIKRLIYKCKEIGAKKCTLWCDKSKWVYDWYKRLGFRYDGEKEDQDGYVWMVKDI